MVRLPTSAVKMGQFTAIDPMLTAKGVSYLHLYDSSRFSHLSQLATHYIAATQRLNSGEYDAEKYMPDWSVLKHVRHHMGDEETWATNFTPEYPIYHVTDVENLYWEMLAEL